MKVGYISGLNLGRFPDTPLEVMQRLVAECVSASLDFLVLPGGLSSNYHMSLAFIEDLGKQLRDSNIQLRFIVGNTDLYYPNEEVTLDKRSKFYEIMAKYKQSQYYLPYNPIITRHTRIVGSESWYDYSLYRGKPRSLKDITRKQMLFVRNKDNDYITDADDYTLGLSNLFDVTYCGECVHNLNTTLVSHEHKYGKCENLVVVTYFKGSKALLSDSWLGKYFGAFEGSLKLGEVLASNHVTQNVYGLRSDKEVVKLNGVTYLNSYGKLRVIDYVSTN